MASRNAIRVAVRLRPLSSEERSGGDRENLKADPRTKSLTLDHPDGKAKDGTKYTYDWAAPPTMSQAEFYAKTVQPLLGKALGGMNATVLAYGQTCSGKTYTMGSEQCRDVAATQRGIIPRFVDDLFSSISTADVDVDAKFSLLELYNEKPRDLLSMRAAVPECSAEDGAAVVAVEPRYLKLRDSENGGVEVAGLEEVTIESADELLELLGQGLQNRVTAHTAMNAVSSRSHCIATISLKITSRVTGADGETCEEFRSSKVTFVDLAGSERAKRTEATGMRMQEGISINKSLLTLGQVINALGDPAKAGGHVPYRDSKLTRLLQDALGGNSQTVFIACVSPATSNIDESRNTLKYANRARNIKNSAVINMSATQAREMRMRAQIAALTRELVKYKFGGGKMASDDDVNELVGQAHVKADLRALLVKASGGAAAARPPRPSPSPLRAPALPSAAGGAAEGAAEDTSIEGEGELDAHVDGDATDVDNVEEATDAEEVATEENMDNIVAAADSKYLLNAARIEESLETNSTEMAEVETLLGDLYTPAEAAVDPEAQAREIEELEAALAAEKSAKDDIEQQLKASTGLAANGPKVQQLKAKLREKHARLLQTEKRLQGMKQQCRALKEKVEQKSRYQEQLKALKKRAIALRSQKARTEKDHRETTRKVQVRLSKATRKNRLLEKKAAQATSGEKQAKAMLERRKRDSERYRLEAKKAKQQLIKFIRRKNASKRRGGGRSAAGRPRRPAAIDAAAATASTERIGAYVTHAAQNLFAQCSDEMRVSLAACGSGSGSGSDATAESSRSAILALVRDSCDDECLAEVFPSTTNTREVLMMLEEQIQERVYHALLFISARDDAAHAAAKAKQLRARARPAAAPLADVTSDLENTPVRVSTAVPPCPATARFAAGGSAATAALFAVDDQTRKAGGRRGRRYTMGVRPQLSDEEKKAVRHLFLSFLFLSGIAPSDSSSNNTPRVPLLSLSLSLDLFLCSCENNGWQMRHGVWARSPSRHRERWRRRRRRESALFAARRAARCRETRSIKSATPT